MWRRSQVVRGRTATPDHQSSNLVDAFVAPNFMFCNEYRGMEQSGIRQIQPEGRWSNLPRNQERLYSIQGLFLL